MQKFDLSEIKKVIFQSEMLKNFSIVNKAPNKGRINLQKNNKKNRNAIVANKMNGST